MESELILLGNKVRYDSTLDYLEINRTHPKRRDERTSLIKDFYPKSLEELANELQEIGRPEAFGRAVMSDFRGLYVDIKEGKFYYEDHSGRYEIGKIDDLNQKQISGLNNTLNLYREVLQTTEWKREMEHLEMCYGDREIPREYSV